jgi:hypothetical protein
LTKLPVSQQGYPAECCSFDNKYFERTAKASTNTPLEKVICAIARRELLARHATNLARWQSSATVTLLAHIAWYFDSQFGLPPSIVGQYFKISSSPDLFAFLENFQRSQFISPTMLDYLLSKPAIFEWAGFEKRESVKRKRESAKRKRESAKRKIEEIILQLQKSLEVQWSLLENSAEATLLAML